MSKAYFHLKQYLLERCILMGWKIIKNVFCYTVHSPLFFRKIIEIERFALRAAILHECQNYLGGGGGFSSPHPEL